MGTDKQNGAPPSVPIREIRGRNDLDLVQSSTVPAGAWAVERLSGGSVRLRRTPHPGYLRLALRATRRLPGEDYPKLGLS